MGGRQDGQMEFSLVLVLPAEQSYLQRLVNFAVPPPPI